MSARSFGHTGYTGTSIWIDPTRDIVIVLLTNRVNPDARHAEVRHAARGGGGCGDAESLPGRGAEGFASEVILAFYLREWMGRGV